MEQTCKYIEIGPFQFIFYLSIVQNFKKKRNLLNIAIASFFLPQFSKGQISNASTRMSVIFQEGGHCFQDSVNLTFNVT